MIVISHDQPIYWDIVSTEKLERTHLLFAAGDLSKRTGDSAFLGQLSLPNMTWLTLCHVCACVPAFDYTVHCSSSVSVFSFMGNFRT